MVGDNSTPPQWDVIFRYFGEADETSVLAQRIALFYCCRDAAAHVDARLWIKGSFLFGDFNLHHGTSLSDLDLVLDGLTGGLRFDVAAAVSQEISRRGGPTLSVSVQPADVFKDLDIEASNIVALCEYLRRAQTAVGSDFRYREIKLAFALLSDGPGERAHGVATRSGDAALWRFFAEKLGRREMPEESIDLDSLIPLERRLGIPSLNHWIESGTATTWCLDKISTSRSIPTWLSSLMVDLLHR